MNDFPADYVPETPVTRRLEDLTGKNIVIFDTEIKKPVEQCTRKWESKDEMGVSVAVAFDYREMRTRIFMDDNLLELGARLNEPGTLIVAFNHIAFDNELLRAAGVPLKPDAELNNYDMLVVSRKACNANKFAGGFKLDDHLSALKLPMKTANGIMAPIWWQEGKIGKVVDYCVADVHSERILFEHAWVVGKFACAHRPTPYEIELPKFS